MSESGLIVREKRRFERYPISLEVELSYPSLPGMGKLVLQTKDMSDGGVFLFCSGEARPAIGTELLLKLTGTLNGEAPPTVKVKVARITDEGVGLQFLDQ